MIFDDSHSLTPDLHYYFFFLLSWVGTVPPAHGPCPSCLALSCPVDITLSLLCRCQMDKSEHAHLPGLWFLLACSLCYPPLTFWIFYACLFKDSKTTACADRQPFSQWQLPSPPFLLLSSSSLSLLNRQYMAPVCNNALQLCLQTNLVRIRHSWFRRRCQRPQLTHNRAIRPAHCSRSHFVAALVPLTEDMSQRIKPSWLRLVETTGVEWYCAQS